MTEVILRVTIFIYTSGDTNAKCHAAKEVLSNFVTSSKELRQKFVCLSPHAVKCQKLNTSKQLDCNYSFKVLDYSSVFAKEDYLFDQNLQQYFIKQIMEGYRMLIVSTCSKKRVIL